MKIEIEIKSLANTDGAKRQVNIELRLLDGAKQIDAIDFPEEYQLSERLLPSIEELLKKNKLQTGDIEEMALVSDMDEAFTTYRIAKSVVEAFNFSKK